MKTAENSPNEDSPALSFFDFSFQYRSQTEPTLRNIRLSVRRGEKILIVGPSGSGKSTLAHCINGLIPHAFKGELTGGFSLLGSDAGKMGIFEVSKKVGTVLQDPDGQFVGLTAGEDIAFAAENDCVPTPEMKDRVRQAAELVQVERHLDKSPQDLSGGQKQRVSMAGVLIDDVEILLFDEPLANLDPATGKKAIELIHRLHEETKKTIIIVEHRLEDVLHCPVDRIVVISRGQIIADGPSGEILASDILRKTGIREPLYLSALRYAGLELRPEAKPESLDSLSFDFSRLNDWAGGLDDLPAARRPEPLLEAQGVSFFYPQDLHKRPVLDDISFSLGRGECVGLVGQNGAGKSTLAKLICGFHSPVSGTLRFAGSDLAGDSIKERSEKIGFVMQNPNQMISFPMIFDEVALGLKARNVPEKEIKERVDEALRICGLYPFRNWPVSALSFGQKKRLTIASILVMGPSLLILDEPTAGQDFKHYTEIMTFLEKLNREENLSLLMITHDMHLMLEYTTRAVVLSEGRLIADASPADVLTDDAIVEAASLKRTSLYDLALKTELDDPRRFVRHFIDYERGRRG